MTPPSENPLVAGANVHGSGHRLWLRDSEPNAARPPGQIGLSGWTVGVPRLVGNFAGRWLDVRRPSRLFWTAPLLMLGATLGCWSCLEVAEPRIAYLILALHLAGGGAIGMLYFRSLWSNAQRFERAGRLRMLLTSTTVRFVLLNALLAGACLEGAMPLLVTALGVLLARAAVLRQVQMAPA